MTSIKHSPQDSDRSPRSPLPACAPERLNAPDPVAAALALRFPGFTPGPEWSEVTAAYPAAAPAEYLALVREPSFSDPVFRQLAPVAEELLATGGADPMGEDEFEAVPGLLHRYPDRALLLVTSACFLRCRHCMRKRQWRSGSFEPGHERLSAWRRYLSAHTEIGEIILSGGDPLTLSDRALSALLKTLRALRPRRALRVHSRALVVAPARVTPGLAALLAGAGVQRLVTQFNHPVEISGPALRAAGTLRAAGIDVENQAVLLRGVNNSAATLAALFGGLDAAGIRPYYLHHPDPAAGAMHFYLPLEAGAAIWRELAASFRGPLPEYVVDLPGREGKRRVVEVARGEE